MLISWEVDELTSKQERVSSCRLIFGKIHYPFTPSLFYSFTPPLPDSLLLYSLLLYSLLLYSLLLYSLLLYSLPLYSLLLYYLLLTTSYSTTYYFLPYSHSLLPYYFLPYYFLPYYSFLFQGITTFCYRQMGRNFRLYRIFVQYFVHERGSLSWFYSTKTINSALFIGIFKIKTTSYHTKR